jgi:hypothetical protein
MMMWVSVVGFWSIILLVQLLLVIIVPMILLLAAMVDFSMTIFQKERVLRFFPSEEEIQTLEDHVCDKYFTGPINSSWVKLTVLMHVVGAHFINVPCVVDTSQNILLVHGNAATGICFVECLKNLSQNFNVYVLDLPGYGRTVAPFNESLWLILNSESVRSSFNTSHTENHINSLYQILRDC